MRFGNIWTWGDSFTLVVEVRPLFCVIVPHFTCALSCVAGAIPSGVPTPALPPFSYVRADNSTADFLDMVSEMGSGLLVIPLIVLLEDIAICKAFSDGRTIDATQEMLALGVANVANAFVGAFPGGGSLARSVVSNGSGVRTPLNGLYTGVMVIVALQFFTQYFEYIPKAALAAVIISAILFMVEYDVVKPMWRAKSECLSYHVSLAPE